MPDFREQGGMLDCIKSSGCGERDVPDLMSDLDGINPLFGELEQHFQGIVTWSESELVS